MTPKAFPIDFLTHQIWQIEGVVEKRIQLKEAYRYLLTPEPFSFLASNHQVVLEPTSPPALSNFMNVLKRLSCSMPVYPGAFPTSQTAFPFSVSIFGAFLQ